MKKATRSPRQASTVRRRSAIWAAALASALALLPTAGASASNVGGGEAHGEVHAVAGSGVPPLNSPCEPTKFDFTGTAVNTVFNTALFGFAGAVEFAGTSVATCEATSSGFGDMEMTKVKNHPDLRLPNSTLDCANPSNGTKLTGGYTRNGAVVTAVLGGKCSVNGSEAAIQLFFRGVFVPNDPEQGTVTELTDGTFVGSFVISPA